MWLALNESVMRQEEQGLGRAEKNNEDGNQLESDRCRDQQQALPKDEIVFDEEFWIGVHQKQNKGLSWNRAMDEVRVEGLIKKYQDNGEMDSVDPALVMLKQWPASKQNRNYPDKNRGLEQLKTVVAVLDQMVKPHWPYLPKRQENYETEEEREAIEGLWNTISDDPLNYHFCYDILDGDEEGQPPKIMASDGQRQTENKYFNWREDSCLHAIAKSNNKEALQHPVVRMLIKTKWRSYGHFFLSLQAALFCIFLLLMSFSLLHASTKLEPTQYSGAMDSLRGFCEVFTLLMVVFYICEEINQTRIEGRSYFTEWMTLFDWLGLLLILCIIPLRYVDHKAQWMVTSLAFLFNFMRIFKFSCVSSGFGDVLLSGFRALSEQYPMVEDYATFNETVRLRHEDPSAFEVDEPTPGSPQYSLGFRKCCARLHDDLFLYYDMTESDDLDKLSGETESNCKFFTYEKERAEHLKLRIDNLLQFCEDTEMSEHNRALFASQIIPVTKRILDAIDDLFKEEVDSMEKDARKDRILRVTSSCKHGLEVLGDLCLPPVKPRWADLTDAGPGVGVSNYEVRFRDAELARVHNSDYRVRCHRSRGDSGQGEAERTNSAISDALVDGATLEWEKYRRFEDLSEEEIKQLSLQSYEEYEKKRMEKNAWYVCSQVAERIDDAPVLKDYIKSKVSESPDELFFFNSVYLDNYRGASERNKEQAPGAAYFRKIESFMEDHYIRGELFMEFCRDACKESREESSNLCSWCSNNRWVGPETERIPQPVPDSNNPGHFMDIYQTESTGRTPDDYLPRKCIKDLYEEHSDSIRNDQDTMKSFCSKYNVEEKHVIAYVNHLKDIEIRKDIRTRAAQERRRQEAERTYKDFQWDNLIEGGKVQKLRVRELDLYLNKHGLTTVGRKLDKVKAIRCHYYRQNKETVITEELSSDEDDVEFEDEESESGEAESDDDYVFVDLDEQPEIGTSSTIQFVSDEQIFTVVVQGP
ncbi:Transient receptor potential cation channel subfamily A member 1 [Stylophora pistillata]|uniref:Transient receptor potential cation channel subfamily A member 1 n=3 Tax=Stylophora pistillata TaxID=50429 RepID=A0A2B4R5E7_STYPI|nr:Transient receptor potential cation channel subfamily A member 1 [Stylophora pistillata]